MALLRVSGKRLINADPIHLVLQARTTKIFLLSKNQDKKVRKLIKVRIVRCCEF